jgi:hypothetical protein
MFRFKKSVPVGYDKQGYIYFMSRLYIELPMTEQQRIRNLCMEAGGEYYQALFEFVTGTAGAEAVCCKHFLSRSTLERIVRKYYIRFAASL